METPAAATDEPFACLGGCGNTLKSRISLARGYGPRCWRKLHGRPARKPRRPRTSPTATPGPDQPELPLPDQLELPWRTP